jgi:SAM-dependent methyltransferase
LELGCGAGGNAVWLAEKGWQVTAVDFSAAAVEKGNQLVSQANVTVEFVVADATSYQPQGQFDLITSFYIQLPALQRARMLATAADALAPGGTLLFVSHDRSAPRQGWSEEDLLTLTTPEQIAAELPGLRIAESKVLMGSSPPHAQGHDLHDGGHGIPESGTTVVLGNKPL